MTDDLGRPSSAADEHPLDGRVPSTPDPDGEGSFVSASVPEAVEPADGVDDEELVPAESTIGVGTVVALGCIAGTVLVVAIALIVLLVIWLFS